MESTIDKITLVTAALILALFLAQQTAPPEK